MVSPPPPIGEPLTPQSPPSSHLKGVVIPSPIVFYLTELFKCQHILLSGRPSSEHQRRGGLHAEINSRNLTSTLRSLLQLKRAYSDSITHTHTHVNMHSFSLSHTIVNMH